jgi:hypothetical protein
MASEYNVGDKTAQYDTKQELMSDISAVSSKVTNGLCFGVECDPAKLKGGGLKKLTKYIRTKGLKLHQDQEDFDWCRLTVATSDVPSELFNRCLGELHVTYTVKMHRPSIKGLKGGNITQALFSRDARIAPTTEFSGSGGLTFDLSPESLCRATTNSFAPELIKKQIADLPAIVMTSGSTPAGGPTEAFCMVFPAQMEGTFKVRLALHCDSDVDVQGCAILSVIGSQVSAIRDINLGLLNGVVVPGSPNKHDSIIFDRDASSGGLSSQAAVEFHIRVTESIAGVDNIVGIVLHGTKKSGAPAEALILNQYLSIEEYNTDVNEEVTGRPEWVLDQDETPIITS